MVTLLARRHRERAEALQAARESRAGDAVLAACTRILIDCANARATLIEQIDRWAAETMPDAPPAALLHTETLGRLMYRVAMTMTWAHWRQLHLDVSSSRGASVGHRAQAAMDEVAALVNAYDDLLAELRIGRRRLPTTVCGATS
ncbi:DUF4254 domain-containing protein [Saccharothrix longispora]|uniref:DUF4254 domain-containing protein n=1 Tax=Saccharothrix longispora TaxID=33920 RepID=UPI0028FD0F19|nr:DUF4254 domain-containing protein [Saccharothrix longispora]MDU0294908.1 DUF4254 domain-containing protein [Saccharothrix longispora]